MVSSIHSLQRSTKQLPPLGVANRCNHQALTVRGQGQGSIRVDVEELKDAAVNHQGETIPMLGQMFDHGDLPNSLWLHCITSLHGCVKRSEHGVSMIRSFERFGDDPMKSWPWGNRKIPLPGPPLS